MSLNAGHSNFEMMRLKLLLEVEPFYEQRDIDVSRLPAIEAAFLQDLIKQECLFFDTPIVLLRCHDSSLLLKSGGRGSLASIDGQHRIAALKELARSRNKITSLQVPVFIHTVPDLNRAREIQYRVFEQKPLDACDKIRKTAYSIADLIEDFVALFREKHSDLAKRHFKPGRYGEAGRRPRKAHFLIEELKHSIKNSPQVGQWISREVQASELVDALIGVHQSTVQRFQSTVGLTEKMNMVNIKKKSEFDAFMTQVATNQFPVLSYCYFKDYAGLVLALEDQLDIVVESDCESEDDLFGPVNSRSALYCNGNLL